MDRARQSARGPALAVAMGLILGSCGGADTPSGSGVGPAQGGTLSIAFNSDIGHLDPALSYDTVSQPAVRLIFDSLLTYDAGTMLVPALAEGMPTVSADGRRYTFKLRAGVQFVQADGSVLREMTADDVAYSINRVLDPSLRPRPSPVGSAFFGNIVGATDVIAGTAETASGIRVSDPLTVEFELVNADRTFLNVMATTFGSIVPREFATDDTAAFDAAPVGSGPFLLESYTKGQSAQFVRNPHYWQDGLPHLDAIDFRLGVDGDAALLQVEAGQLDVMGDPIPSGSFNRVTTDPTYADQIYSHTVGELYFVWMDTQQPEGGPLSNVKVRQAIAHAIDKDHLIQILHGAATKVGCIFPPDLVGFDPECDPYDYDPERAQDLLEDAGYPDGFSTTLFTDTVDPHPQVAEAIQQDLAQIGIAADLQKQEFSTFLDTLFTPHAGPLGYINWVQDYPDVSDFIDPLLSCATTAQGGANASQYCNDAVDTAAATAKGMTDEAARIAAYQEIQRMIMADAPWVPLYSPVRYHITTKRVGGMAIHPVWLIDLRNLSIKADQ